MPNETSQERAQRILQERAQRAKTQETPEQRAQRILSERAQRQVAPQAPVEEPKQDGFLKTVAKDVLGTLLVKPAVRTGQVVGGALARVMGATPQQVDTALSKDVKFPVPILGDINIPAQKAFGSGGEKQIIGDVAKTAAYMFPFGRAATGAASVLKPVLGAAAKPVGAVLSGATGGYLADVGFKGEAGAENMYTPGLGTAIGAAIPGAGALASVSTKAAKAQAPRLINSLIKPLLKDFSYGKNPGRAVAAEGIVGNNLDELAQNIGVRRGQIGSEIEQIGIALDEKAQAVTQGKPTLVQLKDSLKPIDDAMEKAAASNNQTLVNRLQEVKQALEYKLELVTDDAGNRVIRPVERRNLENLSIREASGLKTTVGSMTKWTGNPSDDQAINAALKSVYGNIKSGINDTANKIDTKLGAELMNKNERYADLQSAEIAAKYRDKLQERQNIVSAPIKAGAIAGLLAAPFTGGISLPTIMIGLGAGALEKALGTPAVKTRIAAWLASEQPGVLSRFFSKNPAIENVLRANIKDVKFPGDALLDTSIGKSVLKSVKNPSAGLSIQDVTKSANLPKVNTTQNLINEAKKHESAVEFVEAQGTPVYHGTKSNIDIKNITAQPESRGQYLGNGIYFTKFKEGADLYGGKTINAIVNEKDFLNISNLKGVDRTNKIGSFGTYKQYLKNSNLEDTEINFKKWQKNQQEVADKILDMGYKGVTDGQQHVIFDKSALKTKSQLTDIWNKAHGK